MLSAVVLTKNEQSNLANCLSALNFCTEIIVVDDFSCDETRTVARSFGAKVYKRKLNEDFATQRNFGTKKAKYDWILFIDADERVSKKLKNEILDILKNPKYKGYFLRRKNYWLGKQMNWGEWSETRFLPKYGHNKVLRLGKKRAGVWKRKVHEYWDIENTNELKNHLIHKGHESIRDTLKSLNQQSRLHAYANIAEGKNSNLTKIIFMPTAKFFVNYFVKQGFRDGTHGFVAAIFMSFHSFLAWSQLWLKQKK